MDSIVPTFRPQEIATMIGDLKWSLGFPGGTKELLPFATFALRIQHLRNKIPQSVTLDEIYGVHSRLREAWDAEFKSYLQGNKCSLIDHHRIYFNTTLMDPTPRNLSQWVPGIPIIDLHGEKPPSKVSVFVWVDLTEVFRYLNEGFDLGETFFQHAIFFLADDPSLELKVERLTLEDLYKSLREYLSNELRQHERIWSSMSETFRLTPSREHITKALNSTSKCSYLIGLVDQLRMQHLERCHSAGHFLSPCANATPYRDSYYARRKLAELWIQYVIPSYLRFTCSLTRKKDRRVFASWIICETETKLTCQAELDWHSGGIPQGDNPLADIIWALARYRDQLVPWTMKQLE